MASKRHKRRQRKKTGFATNTHADAKLHHDYQVALRKRRESPSYQLALAIERANH